LDLARRIAQSGIPYVAFGGGEPLSVAHCWELFDRLTAAGISLKIETDGTRIDDAAADRLAALAVQCVQISVDGANRISHERVRPGISFEAATGAIRRLVARGLAPQCVFVPTRINLGEMQSVYDLAASLGCSAFVTGPLMRLGRAADRWDDIACSAAEWARAEAALRAHVDARPTAITLSIYPWDIVTEIERRCESPQAMLLIVPNGKVKLLNALPFSPADLRRESLADAWDAYRRGWRDPVVSAFVAGCRADPRRLRHANETWPIGARGIELGWGMIADPQHRRES